MHSPVQCELTSGLLADTARIAPKFLYDQTGALLFEAICHLPEYYLTRCEAAILAERAPALAAAIGPGCTLIDLGAGNCAKAEALFPALLPASYLPLDLAADTLMAAVAGLRQRWPGIAMTPLVQDFSHGPALPEAQEAGPRLAFYPGSSIGNFSPAAALTLLRSLSAQADWLLLGVDLQKDPALLRAAYDDAIGLSAAFNLNVLRHVNRLLGSDFDPRAWRHHIELAAKPARVAMHLEARSDLAVCWPGCERRFRRGQHIHTEDSHKYTPAAAAGLVEEAGFQVQQVWTDTDQWFALVLGRVLRH